MKQKNQSSHYPKLFIQVKKLLKKKNVRLAIPKILITIPQRLCLINCINMPLGINEQNIMCCMLGLIMKAWAAGPIYICGAVNINDRKADGLKGASFTVVIVTFPPLGLWNPQ